MRDIAFKIWRTLPDPLRISLDIRRRAPRWRDAGVIFVHVPKAAGVSVSRALYGRPLGHFLAKDIRRVYPDGFLKLLTFGVVRHPLDRAYSAYRFARAGGTSEMGMGNPAQYRTEAFSTFERFVTEWLPKQDIERSDGVFRPQHLYLCDGGDVIVDKVFKLEDIDRGFDELSQLLGRKVVLGHHNKSEQPSPEPPSEKALAVIAELYKKDLEIFSYAMPRPI